MNPLHMNPLIVSRPTSFLGLLLEFQGDELGLVAAGVHQGVSGGIGEPLGFTLLQGECLGRFTSDVVAQFEVG